MDMQITVDHCILSHPEIRVKITGSYIIAANSVSICYVCGVKRLIHTGVGTGKIRHILLQGLIDRSLLGFSTLGYNGNRRKVGDGTSACVPSNIGTLRLVSDLSLLISR